MKAQHLSTLRLLCAICLCDYGRGLAGGVSYPDGSLSLLLALLTPNPSRIFGKTDATSSRCLRLQSVGLAERVQIALNNLSKNSPPFVGYRKYRIFDFSILREMACFASCLTSSPSKNNCKFLFDTILA